MPRKARIILPDYPHHVTQRGNRRMPVFFREDDYRMYKSLLNEHARQEGLEIWAYCLMPNHVHVIAVPHDYTALSQVFRETHRRYTRFVNDREGWSGYLWQGRFSSFPMTESHALMAMRYVENNPVTAGLTRQPEDYVWSSAKAHMGMGPDPVLSLCPLEERVRDWRGYLQEGLKGGQSTVDETVITTHLKSGDTLK